MPTTLDKAAPKIHVAEIVHHGEQLILPAGVTIDDAIALLKRRKEYDNEVTEVSATFDCFPWDGAHALFQTIKRRFGWASMETVYTFFGPQRPQIIEIENGYGTVTQITWGRLSLFKEDGFIDCGVAKKGARYIFKATATVKRKHEGFVKELYQEVRVELKHHSLYRGQAVSLRFRTDNGESMSVPEAKFVDTRGATRESLIFSSAVQAAIDTNLFTPIERMEDCKRAHIPVKRGILLTGQFGVGKTLAAKVAAALAVANEKTFIYCKRADEFPEAVEFALQYQPAILFCEDIDRVVTGARSAEMDTILNIIDGVDTKNAEVIFVLTSNAPEKINPAILRPGRLDAVIEVTPPDTEAVIRLIHLYGGDFIDKAANLTRAAELLAGNIPAVIEEVVKRSKLSALKTTPLGTTDFLVGEEALAEAADTMKMQLRLLNPEKYTHLDDGQSSIDRAFHTVVEETTTKAMRKVMVKAGFEIND